MNGSAISSCSIKPSQIQLFAIKCENEDVCRRVLSRHLDTIAQQRPGQCKQTMNHLSQMTIEFHSHVVVSNRFILAYQHRIILVYALTH
jgi:hypothetical protein